MRMRPSNWATERLHAQVLLHHGFGDFLMAVPVLRALQRRRRSVDVVVKAEAIAAFGREVVADPAISWFVRGTDLPSWLSLAARLRARRPSVFLGVHAQGRRSGWFARATGAPLRVGPVARYGYNAGVMDRPKFGAESVYDERRHKVNLYLDFLKPLGVQVDAAYEDLHIEAPRAIQEEVARRFPFLADRRIIGIAPSCGLGKHKMWNAGKFADVIETLSLEFEELQFVLVGGEENREDGLSITRRLSRELDENRVHDLTGETSLTELLAIVGRLSLLITICNGPSHVAAAAGIPVVGLYGPTNPGFTGPFSDLLYVVRMGYSCSPCYRTSFEEGCGNPRCMQDIETTEVLTQCRVVLRGEPPTSILGRRNTLARDFSP